MTDTVNKQALLERAKELGRDKTLTDTDRLRLLVGETAMGRYDSTSTPVQGYRDALVAIGKEIDLWNSPAAAIGCIADIVNQVLSQPDIQPLTLRESVRWFAEKMELTLRENDHKGGWSDCDPHWLMARLREESHELDNEVRFNGRGKRTERVVQEAADVANFAMMIADNARKWAGINSTEDQPEPDNALIGEWSTDTCPRCGAVLLINRRGDKWCSNVGGAGMSACSYGLKSSTEEEETDA